MSEIAIFRQLPCSFYLAINTKVDPKVDLQYQIRVFSVVLRESARNANC